MSFEWERNYFTNKKYKHGNTNQVQFDFILMFYLKKGVKKALFYTGIKVLFNKMLL